MALLSREVYEAMREIGINHEHALKAAEALALPHQTLTDILTDMAMIHTQMQHLTHRLTHVLVLAYLLLGGLVSTLWVLARR